MTWVPDLDFFHSGSRGQKSAGSGLATLSTALWTHTLSTVLRNPAFETYVGHVYIDAECFCDLLTLYLSLMIC
jgi:hypothetical protein